MKLTGEQEAVVLAGARSVPDDARDKFFKMVADALRGAGRQRNQDVKRAVMIARQKCSAPKPFDRVAHDNEFLLALE
jgi:hypothetical protein